MTNKTFMRFLSSAALLSIGVTGAVSAPAANATTTTQLTLWSNGTLEASGFGFLNRVISGFEKSHPGVTIQVVAKPSDDYFSLLQASLISGTGPDIAQVYGGLDLAPLLPHLVNLNRYIPVSTLSHVVGTRYYAKNGKISDGTYGVPSENQYYNMFYNKALFKKAGITSVPTDWAQAVQDATLLKAHGILPWVYGALPGTSEFVDVYDWSYLLSSVYPLPQWNSLLDGKIPYTAPKIVSQMTKWAGLYKAGYVNKNALNFPGTEQTFEQGKAAMIMSWSGLVPNFEKALGNNLGIMLPPWSPTPQHTVIEYPGGGFSVLQSSKYAKLSAEFVAATVSRQAQQFAVADGQPPVVSGVQISDPLVRQLTTWATSPSYSVYPMFDNYFQPNVSTAFSKNGDAAFVGDMSPLAALQSMTQALNALPADQRNENANL